MAGQASDELGAVYGAGTVKRAPWFKLWAADFLSDNFVDAMTPEQIGWYCILLIRSWNHTPQGYLPNDEHLLSNWCKVVDRVLFREQAKLVLDRFEKTQDGSLIFHPKLIEQVDHISQVSEKRSDAGKKSAKKRGMITANKCSTSVQQVLTDSDSDSDKHPPNPPKGERKKRRSRTEILSPYPPQVSELVNDILPNWPKVQPKDRSPIHFDVPMTAERIDEILRQPGVTPEILKQAASKYLGEQKNYYRAPQFFFGPGAGEKSPPWVAYARMTVHQEAQRGLQ
jgi:uncharacterized protein YdaU (DUF1376 family)